MGQVVTILSVAQIEDKPTLCHIGIINMSKTKPDVLMRLLDLLRSITLLVEKLLWGMGCFSNKKDIKCVPMIQELVDGEKVDIGE